MKYLFYILSCLLVVTEISANEVAMSQFKKANTDYSNKAYQKAIEGYENILKTGYQSTELYYNLGNAYFRNKELAAAILNYERALVNEPYNDDVQYNLKIANQRTVDNISTLYPVFFITWWGAFRDVLSSSTWAWLAVILFWLGIGGLIIWLMANTRNLRKGGFLGGISLLILSSFMIITAWQRYELERDSDAAIIFAQETLLKSSPDKESPDILQLHEGTKVELLDKIGGWYKVRLMNGEQGWLPKQSFVEI